MIKYFVFVILFLLAGCGAKVERVYDGQKTVKVSLGDRLFLVPKKYIDITSVPVPNPIVRGQYGSMNAYFYWPNLEGLSDSDEQQRFGRFNHYVVSMQWQLLKNVDVQTKTIVENIEHNYHVITEGKNCAWNGLTDCKYIYNSLDQTYFFVGKDKQMNSFMIRCHSETLLMDDYEVCNFEMDYFDRGLNISGLVSSSFIRIERFPQIIEQMKTFLNQWEQKSKE
ncbi:hypothetical protein [Acinetobacter rudis]|uniref:Lipoprotein n=2 Tax=Acinetobacter rudis TaxID=632955 RepID=A0AAW8J685_9GAMM|nr:hypothetical protein [Acinetobacter rudis]MDQ8934638.1 hypothetical protein [Acinetobacter rudis]MDQ9016792.1 hypothetical protein [Acinetobacter rudis]